MIALDVSSPKVIYIPLITPKMLSVMKVGSWKVSYISR